MIASEQSKLQPTKYWPVFCWVIPSHPCKSISLHKEVTSSPKILLTLNSCNHPHAPWFCFHFKRNYPVEVGICLLVVICAHLQKKGRPVGDRVFLKTHTQVPCFLFCVSQLLQHDLLIMWITKYSRVYWLDRTVILRGTIILVTECPQKQHGNWPFHLHVALRNPLHIHWKRHRDFWSISKWVKCRPWYGLCVSILLLW